MKLFKLFVTTTTIAAVLLLSAGCDNTSGTDNSNDNSSGSHNTGIFGSGNRYETVYPEEYSKMWEFIPEAEYTSADELVYTYSADERGIVVSDYSGEAAVLRIPDEIEDKPVVAVDLSETQKELTEVIFPNSVRSFKLSGAISGALKYANVPAAAETFSFGYCEKLESIFISSGVSEINEEAFAHCTSLKNIRMSEGLRMIGNNAFSYCTSISSIKLPESLSTIDGSPFSFCTNLTAIDVDENNPYFAAQNGVLYSKDMTRLVQCPAGRKGKFSIKSGITEIENAAFFGCTGITEITIPESVEKIGDWAFSSTQITSINIPKKITKINSGVFYSTKLSFVEIPENVASIGDYAFSGCGELGAIVIPEGVKEIGSGAFSDCTMLSAAELPNNLEKIGEWAFSKCEGLVSVYIPGGVTSIGDSAFYGCTGLRNANVPSGVTDMGESVFEECANVYVTYKGMTYTAANADEIYLLINNSGNNDIDNNSEINSGADIDNNNNDESQAQLS